MFTSESNSYSTFPITPYYDVFLTRIEDVKVIHELLAMNHAFHIEWILLSNI